MDCYSRACTEQETAAANFAAILADENDLQWFAKELGQALIVKVRGVRGADDDGSKDITLLNRMARHGQTMSGRPIVEWETDPRHVEIITEHTTQWVRWVLREARKKSFLA